MQAQDYQQALWAIGLRTHGATQADVESAIAEGKIVRTWALRGTIHFVLAEDLGWMMNLGSDRLVGKDAGRLRQLGLKSDDIERSQELLAKSLRRHHRVSRPKLMELLDLEGISTEGQRGYHILWHAAQSGLLCMGPMEGKQQTFVLVDEWVKNSRQLSHEDSLRELATRYFQSHGPATVSDLAWWAGLTKTDAQLAVELAKGALLEQLINDVPHFAASFPNSPVAGAHLLAGFDEYVLGYEERNGVLAPEHADKVVPGGNGVFFPTMLLDGRIVGTWKRKLTKASVQITLSPFDPLDNATSVFAEAALRYTTFLGLKLAEVVVGAAD